jgi:hypothetical protein
MNKEWKEVNRRRMEASFDKFWQANWPRLSGTSETMLQNRAMCREGWDAAMQACQETFDTYETSLADTKADADRLAEALKTNLYIWMQNVEYHDWEPSIKDARAALAAHEEGKNG